MVRRLLLAGAGATLLLSLVSPASADPLTLKVAHGPATATVVPVTPGVASPGDLRLFYVKLTKPGKKKAIGFMTGSLLTTAVGKPLANQEMRTADLVFTVGGDADQIIVGGVAAYDQLAPTVAQRSTVVRPVVGGSGAYDGARGWCTSVHRKDGTWRHTFRVTTN